MSQNGTYNTGLEGQCTWGANQWYHDVTGYWVPWGANAKDYASQATIYGWAVSSQPVVPSIVCFQPGVQGANSTYGHVAFAHTIKGNAVITRNLNYGPNPSVGTDLTNYAGVGVSFVYATDTVGRPIGGSNSSIARLSDRSGLIARIASPNADVTDLLAFFDLFLELRNPFQVEEATFQAWGFSIPDPVGYVEAFGGNLFEDMAAMAMRLVFIIIGVFILFRISSNWIDYGAIAKNAAMLAI